MQSDDAEVEYPYYYWAEHVGKLSVSDLEKDIDGPVCKFLSNQHLMNRFSGSTSLDSWVKDVLLKFIVTSVWFSFLKLQVC